MNGTQLWPDGGGRGGLRLLLRGGVGLGLRLGRRGRGVGRRLRGGSRRGVGLGLRPVGGVGGVQLVGSAGVGGRRGRRCRPAAERRGAACVSRAARSDDAAFDGVLGEQPGRGHRRRGRGVGAGGAGRAADVGAGRREHERRGGRGGEQVPRAGEPGEGGPWRGGGYWAARCRPAGGRWRPRYAA